MNKFITKTYHEFFKQNQVKKDQMEQVEEPCLKLQILNMNKKVVRFFFVSF